MIIGYLDPWGYYYRTRASGLRTVNRTKVEGLGFQDYRAKV